MDGSQIVPMLDIWPTELIDRLGTMFPLPHQEERTPGPGFPSSIAFSFLLKKKKKLLKHEILPFSTGIFSLCPEKQSYRIQEGKGCKGRETGTVPTDVLPGGRQPGAGNKCCVKGKPDYIRGSRLKGWLVPAAGRTLSHKVQE